MIVIRVIPGNIPQNVLDSDVLLKNTKVKTLTLTRIPNQGEWLIWRNQNFKITKVVHLAESNTHDALVEMDWCESL